MLFRSRLTAVVQFMCRFMDVWAGLQKKKEMKAVGRKSRRLVVVASEVFDQAKGWSPSRGMSYYASCCDASRQMFRARILQNSQNYFSSPHVRRHRFVIAFALFLSVLFGMGVGLSVSARFFRQSLCGYTCVRDSTRLCPQGYTTCVSDSTRL